RERAGAHVARDALRAVRGGRRRRARLGRAAGRRARGLRRGGALGAGREQEPERRDRDQHLPHRRSPSKDVGGAWVTPAREPSTPPRRDSRPVRGSPRCYFRGSHEKNLAAATSPPSPHRSRIRTSCHSNRNGRPSKPARMASAKCLTGKMVPTVLIHAGELSPSGMKMPDRNRSGRMMAFTTAGPASAFGTIAVVARPSAAKLAPPATT